MLDTKKHKLQKLLALKAFSKLYDSENVTEQNGLSNPYHLAS